MNPDAARALAHQLLLHHGLDGWRFRFDHAKRRLGCCHYGSRTISLSKPLTVLNDEAVVRDTLLHEVAHALTPGAGHGPAWRRQAVAIGAAPRRCADATDVRLPPAPYALVCDGCGARLPRYRRPRRRLVCRPCWDRHVRGAGPRPAALRVVAQTAGAGARRVSGTP
ncbi:MAG: SprT-like domain-containing protein [Trueperaceae bacterium]